MPTGVALTRPADWRERRRRIGDDLAAMTADCRRQALGLLRIAVAHQQALQPEIEEGEGDGAPRPAGADQHGLPRRRRARGRSSPRRCGESRCGRCCGRRCGPLRSMVTVLTAPISRASALTSSSSGSTASLQGKVTLTPAKPAVRAAASRSDRLRPGRQVEIHQVVVAGDAERPRRHPRTARATATSGCWPRSGRRGSPGAWRQPL